MASKRNSAGLNGIILVDKPAGWTSHDVVAKLRALTGQRRIGHAGTLDPAATGLLVVMFGVATRLEPYLVSAQKSYRATISFGRQTDTDDAQGQTIRKLAVPVEIFNISNSREIVKALCGKQHQIPPKYSAIKKGGIPAYKAARSGAALEMDAREVEIFNASLVDCNSNKESYTLELTVSKGTYIRSIARDLGISLNTCAHLSDLRRTASGDFSVDDALTLTDIAARVATPQDMADLFVSTDLICKNIGPSFTISDQEVETGNPLPISVLSLTVENSIRNKNLFCAQSLDGRILGVYSRCGVQLKAKAIFLGGIYGTRISGAVVTMGVFDGVHKGHAKLIQTCVNLAHERGLASAVITLDRNPKEVLESGVKSCSLLPLSERIERLYSLGIDHVLLLPFSKEMSKISAEQFIKTQLCVRVRPSVVIVGDNHHFGNDGLGDSAVLENELSSLGTEVIVSKLSQDDASVVSSTRVRQLLNDGRVADANALLGYSFSLKGKVVSSRGIGSLIGYPTANIEIGRGQSLPQNGVYLTSTTLADGKVYQSLTFVGVPSNSKTEKRGVETYIIDFHSSVKGKQIRVEFLLKIRENILFDSDEDLRCQIEIDLLSVEQKT